MIKLGVLSDTHIHSLDAGIVLAERLLNGVFSDVDAILHAGDHVLSDLSNCFYPIPWYGVKGNMDEPIYNLPLQRILKIGGYNIGMIHGWGAPQGVVKRVQHHFSADDIDILIFGHSHSPLCRSEGGVLLMNPGSPTEKRSSPFHTVGLLSLGESVNGEIVVID